MYRTRTILIVLVVAAAGAAWLATGRAAITTWPDPEVDAMLAGPLADRFAETPAALPTERPTRFQLGLLPDGPARGWPSVLTIALAGVALACAMPNRNAAAVPTSHHPELIR